MFGGDRAGRSSRGGSVVRSRTVDSMPTGLRPASRIKSTLPSRSFSTCSAIVGDTRFERFALGAAIGRPSASINLYARKQSGIRTPTVSPPAVTISGIRSVRGSTIVSGPHQKRCGQLRSRERPSAHDFPNHLDIMTVNNQRIRRGPALRLKDRGHRLGIRGVGTETINRLGRKRDETAAAEHFGGFLDRGRVGPVAVDDQNLGANLTHELARLLVRMRSTSSATPSRFARRWRRVPNRHH